MCVVSYLFTRSGEIHFHSATPLVIVSARGNITGQYVTDGFTSTIALGNVDDSTDKMVERIASLMLEVNIWSGLQKNQNDKVVQVISFTPHGVILIVDEGYHRSVYLFFTF